MRGMPTLRVAAEKLMPQALDVKDWKSTLGGTVDAYAGGLALNTEDGMEQMSKTAAGQLFSMIGLPVKVLEPFNDAPELQIKMVKHHLDKLSKEKRERSILCRGRVVKGRTVFDSFLSDSYIPIGNFQIINAVVEAFEEMGIEAYAHKSQIHNRQLSMRIVAPEWYHELGERDTAYTGLAVINDEIGRSAIRFQACVARVACFNYTIHSEPVFEHSHRWLPPNDILRGIHDGIGILNSVAKEVSQRLVDMRDVVIDDVASMIKVAGQEIGLPNYAIKSAGEWWESAGAQDNLFMLTQAIEFGAATMTDRKGFHWWRRQLAEQQIYDMSKKFQETGRLELCTCPSCHRPLNVIDLDGEEIDG